MLRTALEFLSDELNTYLQRKDAVNFQQGKTAIVSNLMKPDGSFAVDSNNGQGNEKFNIVLTLINLEEDRVAESQWYYRKVGDKTQVVNPPLNLNLFVLVTAVADQYLTALTLLNHVLSFFQANPVFDDEKYPHLNAKADPLQPWFFLKQIIANLHPLTLEQQNNLWAALGGKYMPSVVYKVRALTYTDQEPDLEAPPITEIKIASN